MEMGVIYTHYSVVFFALQLCLHCYGSCVAGLKVKIVTCLLVRRRGNDSKHYCLYDPTAAVFRGLLGQ